MAIHDMLNNVHVYDNVSDFITDEVDSGRTGTLSKESRGTHWDDGMSGYDAAKYGRVGHEGTMGQFAGMLDNLEHLSADIVRPTWCRSVAGSRVSVPDYLCGAPDHMRRKARNERTTRHVNIYVSQVCSAGIPASVMLKRGATILAYLDMLQRTGVNVDLHLVVDLDGRTSEQVSAKNGLVVNGYMNYSCTLLVRVESRPLNLSQSGFVISHPAWSRNVCYRVADKYGFGGGWSAEWNAHGIAGRYDAYTAAMRKRIGMSETDVFIPPVYLTDTIVTNPEQWLTERLRQLKPESM